MKIARTLLLLVGIGVASACAVPGRAWAESPAPVAAVEEEPSAFVVHFGSGKTNITASTMQILWEAGHTAAAAGSGVIRISGYADTKGSVVLNRRLSRLRAEAVAAQLVKVGLTTSRMVVDGFGSRKGGGDAADDRRVEIVFTPEGPVNPAMTPMSPSPITVLSSAVSPAATPSPVAAATPLAAIEDQTDDEALAAADHTNDPLESINRSIFEFNQSLDSAVIKPVAEGYRDNVPEYARDRIHDFLDNWSAPMRFANDVAQGDIDRAVETFIRFTFNTGFGIGGLFDLASAGGIPDHQTDVGATFGVWGIGEGPYLVLPILGPSNPRDLAGLAVDFEFDPVGYRIGEFDGYRWVTETHTVLSGLDKRERNIDSLNEVERTSIDFYAAIRSLYRQHREAEINHRPEIDKLPSPGLTSLPASGRHVS